MKIPTNDAEWAALSDAEFRALGEHLRGQLAVSEQKIRGLYEVTRAEVRHTPDFLQWAGPAPAGRTADEHHAARLDELLAEVHPDKVLARAGAEVPAPPSDAIVAFRRMLNGGAP